MCEITKCCCFRLKTGGVIIAILDILASISGIILCVLALASGEETFPGFYLWKLFCQVDPILTGVVIAAEIINLIVCLLLLCGIKKEKANLVSPWLLYTAILFVIINVYAIYLLLNVEIITIVLAVILNFWITAVLLHFFNTIYSLRERFKWGDKNFVYIHV